MPLIMYFNLITKEGNESLKRNAFWYSLFSLVWSKDNLFKNGVETKLFFLHFAPFESEFLD